MGRYGARVIVWLASYPRSGNTFLRIVIHRLYGRGSTTVYPVDGVRERLGDGLLAPVDRADALDVARNAAEVVFVKTHRRRGYDVAEGDRSLYVVRDGRDALVSFARQRAEGDPGRYRDELRSLIDRRRGGTAGWGQNVLSWLPPADSAAPASEVVIRFEDLIADPVRVVTDAVSRVASELSTRSAAAVPTFDQLHDVDPQFFRSGVSGTYRDELPADLEDLFWSYEDNRLAMNLLGYGDDRASRSTD